MPAYFQDWLFDYVAVILYNTNRMFNSLWSESSLQASVARDYSIFFWIVAFGAYLLSVTWADISNEAWSCEGECDTEDEDEDVDAASFNPSVAVKLMARAVPRHAWPFAAIFLLLIGNKVTDALRVVPYLKYELLKRAKVASDAGLEESLEPRDANLGAPAGWEAFALLVGATFACISPFTCAVCYLYFVAAYEVTIRCGTSNCPVLPRLSMVDFRAGRQACALLPRDHALRHARCALVRRRRPDPHRAVYRAGHPACRIVV